MQRESIESLCSCVDGVQFRSAAQTLFVAAVFLHGALAWDGREQAMVSVINHSPVTHENMDSLQVNSLRVGKT